MVKHISFSRISPSVSDTDIWEVVYAAKHVCIPENATKNAGNNIGRQGPIADQETESWRFQTPTSDDVQQLDLYSMKSKESCDPSIFGSWNAEGYRYVSFFHEIRAQSSGDITSELEALQDQHSFALHWDVGWRLTD